MKKINNWIVVILLIIAAGMNCKAQDNDRALLRQVLKENQEAVNAIAMYPTETRKIIFEAAEYPEVIAKLNAMQKTSQENFEKLIGTYSKEEQEKIWNLTRYPDLISDIAAGQRKSEAEINNIVLNYPEEIHKTALEIGLNNYELVVQIDNMNKAYNSDFELLLNGYPPEAADAFREIIKLPEVLTILFDHMQYTVVIGDYYKKNPERVLHKTDSLNLVLTQKNAKETDDWKQSMNEDPQAQQEYTQAAQDYAQENGYQPEDYNTPLTPDVTNYNTNSYSWWFGYPSWYPYDYWNPYPYWYDWGFYNGPGGHIIFFGLPSAYFMNWYFYHPEHCYRYPELSNHYYNYYERHRDSRNYNSVSHSVDTWRNRNKDIVTDDWDKDNSHRVQRFKEYGQMEMNRTTYNTKHPQKQLNQTEYLQKKQSNYPVLATGISNKQIIQKEHNTNNSQENMQQPVKEPRVTIPEQYKVPSTGQSKTNKQQQPEYKSPEQNNNSRQNQGNVTIQPRNPNPVKPTENNNQMRNAQQYHENTWKQIEPQQQPVRQQPQQNYSPPARQQENRQVQQPVRENNQAPSNNRRK